MSPTLSNPIPFSLIIALSIPVVLWGIIALSIRMSFRLRKVECPKLKIIIAIAFLQTLLGILTIYIVESIKYEPLLIIGAGLGITILSGLLFLKMFVKNNWKQTLRTWVIATVMQLVFVPVCSGVMLLGWFVYYFMNHPPQP